MILSFWAAINRTSLKPVRQKRESQCSLSFSHLPKRDEWPSLHRDQNRIQNSWRVRKRLAIIKTARCGPNQIQYTYIVLKRNLNIKSWVRLLLSLLIMCLLYITCFFVHFLDIFLKIRKKFLKLKNNVCVFLIAYLFCVFFYYAIWWLWTIMRIFYSKIAVAVNWVSKNRVCNGASPKIRQGLILIFFRKITPGPILGEYHLFSFIKNTIAK